MEITPFLAIQSGLTCVSGVHDQRRRKGRAKEVTAQGPAPSTGLVLILATPERCKRINAIQAITPRYAVVNGFYVC